MASYTMPRKGPLSLITREESSKRDSRRVTTDSATSNVGDVEGGDAELFEDGEVFFGVEGGGRGCESPQL